jgi:hypothetical protein
MSDDEITYNRNLSFSLFHRYALPPFCKAIDLDFLEYCDLCGNILGLIEITLNTGKWKATTLLRHLACQAQVKAWCITYDLDEIHKVVRPKISNVISAKIREVWPNTPSSAEPKLSREDLIDWFVQLHANCQCGKK